MPSAIQFSGQTANKATHQSIYTRPAKKQKMSITQTYFLAHSARGKLSKEASRGDHNLRLLVGHANMLDTLMLDLANAEQEQERWFNKSVSGAREEEEEVEHIEAIEEEDEEEFEVTAEEVDSDMDDDEETDSELTLTRTPSRHSPPSLSSDSDSDSEDESMPSSPPSPTSMLIDTLSEKQRAAIATTSFYDLKDSSLSPVESEAFETEGFYLPSRQQPTIIAAY